MRTAGKVTSPVMWEGWAVKHLKTHQHVWPMDSSAQSMHTCFLGHMQCIPAFSPTWRSVIWDMRLAHTCPHSQWKFWSHFLVPHSHVATVLPLYATSIESRALMVSHKTCAIQQVLAAPLPQPVAEARWSLIMQCTHDATFQHSGNTVSPR